ncbi:MAG: sigma-70 family RNA polymerase sigma factor [Planctomycetales bacterium]|nr:sigma-70 family RNA polymerase sigma factor [Planctomycetales bacterium]
MTTDILTQPPETSTIAQLVRAAQAGDHSAFSQLVERFEQTVYATALRRLRNHDEAQELCQEVFVRVLEKIHQLQTPEAFPGWIRSITVRMAINRAVRSAPTASTDNEVLEAVCVEPVTPLANALESERREHLYRGLDRLTEMDRDTLVAFYIEGQSLVEMSDGFASPVGTIKRRLHVARKRLAKQLESLAV